MEKRCYICGSSRHLCSTCPRKHSLPAYETENLNDRFCSDFNSHCTIRNSYYSGDQINKSKRNNTRNFSDSKGLNSTLPSANGRNNKFSSSVVTNGKRSGRYCKICDKYGHSTQNCWYNNDDNNAIENNEGSDHYVASLDQSVSSSSIRDDDFLKTDLQNKYTISDVNLVDSNETAITAAAAKTRSRRRYVVNRASNSSNQSRERVVTDLDGFEYRNDGDFCEKDSSDRFCESSRRNNYDRRYLHFENGNGSSDSESDDYSAIADENRVNDDSVVSSNQFAGRSKSISKDYSEDELDLNQDTERHQEVTSPRYTVECQSLSPSKYVVAEDELILQKNNKLSEDQVNNDHSARSRLKIGANKGTAQHSGTRFRYNNRKTTRPLNSSTSSSLDYSGNFSFSQSSRCSTNSSNRFVTEHNDDSVDTDTDYDDHRDLREDHLYGDGHDENKQRIRHKHSDQLSHCDRWCDSRDRASYSKQSTLCKHNSTSSQHMQGSASCTDRRKYSNEKYSRPFYQSSTRSTGGRQRNLSKQRLSLFKLTESVDITCYNCGRTGHKSFDCPESGLNRHKLAR
ncbi:hypothetical protein GJ496_003626 [Pomphorhynchus laevis]|nr:hypothetical protein GJ496_003626 [Pomphorhynchus laevis]